MKASYIDGQKIVVDDQVYLYLYGTSYLGLPYNSDFQQLQKEGQIKYGSSLGSSPGSTPQLAIYSELEELLASKYGYEAAILFPSGYAAGQTIMSVHQEQGHQIEYGNVAHPALKLNSHTNEPQVESHSENSKIYAVDFIDPITFEKFDLSSNRDNASTLLIDISHGLGLFDEEIKAVSKLNNSILCGSLNKALGINAGVVLCTNALKNRLCVNRRYSAASAPSPSECYALLKAFETGLINAQQNKLNGLMKLFLNNKDVSLTKGFPVLKFQNNTQQFYEYLKQNEILIWRNSYPDPDSDPINRAVFSAAHQEDDINLIFDYIGKSNS